MSATVINIIGGPGLGKSLFAAELFAFMKRKQHLVELVPEYAKTLVWTQEWELLSNQHHVSYYQYKQIKCLQDMVDYIVVDGSLLQGVYYAYNNVESTSDPEKTESLIYKYMSEFNNEFVHIQRDKSFCFEEEGRVQNLEGALHADRELKCLLDGFTDSYTEIGNKKGDVEKVYEALVSDH